MKDIINTDVVGQAWNYMFSKLPEVGLSGLAIYQYAHPSNSALLPKQFMLIKTIGTLRDVGNIDVYGTLEFCLYALNLNKNNDQSQPDLASIDSLTKKIYPILQDAIFSNTAITEIKQQIVSHSEIKYYYQSLVCQTINLKS